MVLTENNVCINKQQGRETKQIIGNTYSADISTQNVAVNTLKSLLHFHILLGICFVQSPTVPTVFVPNLS